LGDPVPKSETRLYVYQTHEKFHSGIEHSITPWNITVSLEQSLSIIGENIGT